MRRCIAKQGYVVFAEDIFGKDVRPKEVSEQIAQSTKYNDDRPLMRARAQAGLDVLRNNPMVDASKIAVVGYCFGGTVAVELAETGAPVLGTVTIHGSFRNFTPDAAKNIHGRVLILHGAEDPIAPLTEVDLLIKELRAANVSWQMDLYSGTKHGVFDAEESGRRARQQGITVRDRAFLQGCVRTLSVRRRPGPV